MTAGPPPQDWLGRKLLILGDVNAGKTTFTRAILEAFCRQGLGPRVAVLDLAPEIPAELAERRGLPGVGGGLVPPAGAGALYLRDRLEPPRLSSTSGAEALRKAEHNRLAIDRLLQDAELARRDIVFANDVTLYLQAGSAATLLERLGHATTLVVNGYWGDRLGSGELSRRERAETAKLLAWFEAAGTVMNLPLPVAG
ncbi:MAG TPA: hypothetical protein VN649_21880 [Ramlibacter sp.]|nr:hypothetical protein [Ramlibacter sp.]